MPGDLSVLALSEPVCVCVPAGECVGNGVGVCICVPYIPRRNAFPGSWRLCFGCWGAKFRLLLSNFQTHPTPPHPLPPSHQQPGRQTGSELGASYYPHHSPKLQTPTSLCLVPRLNHVGNQKAGTDEGSPSDQNKISARSDSVIHQEFWEMLCCSTSPFMQLSQQCSTGVCLCGTKTPPPTP